jgi:hypothetical protein
MNIGRGDLLASIATLWYTYDWVKQSTIGYVKQKADRLAFNMGQLTRQLNSSIGPRFDDVSNWVSTDPILEEGGNGSLKKNMDCRVIGLGMNNSVNALCGAGLEYVYILRFLYSATGVIIMFICLLTICLIKR